MAKRTSKRTLAPKAAVATVCAVAAVAFPAASALAAGGTDYYQTVYLTPQAPDWSNSAAYTVNGIQVNFSTLRVATGMKMVAAGIGLCNQGGRGSLVEQYTVINASNGRQMFADNHSNPAGANIDCNYQAHPEGAGETVPFNYRDTYDFGGEFTFIYTQGKSVFPAEYAVSGDFFLSLA